jgi:hypothetical protein
MPQRTADRGTHDRGRRVGGTRSRGGCCGNRFCRGRFENRLGRSRCLWKRLGGDLRGRRTRRRRVVWLDKAEVDPLDIAPARPDALAPSDYAIGAHGGVGRGASLLRRYATRYPRPLDTRSPVRFAQDGRVAGGNTRIWHDGRLPSQRCDIQCRAGAGMQVHPYVAPCGYCRITTLPITCRLRRARESGPQIGPERPSITVGRSQVVRHRILIPAYGGSNPPAPANSFKPSRGYQFNSRALEVSPGYH